MFHYCLSFHVISWTIEIAFAFIACFQIAFISPYNQIDYDLWNLYVFSVVCLLMPFYCRINFIALLCVPRQVTDHRCADADAPTLTPDTLQAHHFSNERGTPKRQ